MTPKRHALTSAEETLVRILSDAAVDDLVAGRSDALWIAVRCNDESEQKQLADRFRAEGREVILRSRTA
jgi:hypothetical protein